MKRLKNQTLYTLSFDDSDAEKNATTKHSNSFARHNNVVPIDPVLTKIKIRPGKPSSPEIQRTQFPLTLGYACTAHKVQGLH